MTASEQTRGGPGAAYTRVPLFYFLWATAYILVSTLAVGLYFGYGPHVIALELAKGTGFVVVTALILWVILRRQLRAGDHHEARFYSLVENLPDAVFLLRIPERTIVYANPAAQRMFGYDTDELVGASSELLHIDTAHFSDFRAHSPEGLGPGDSLRLDYEMRRRSGEIFPTSHVVVLFAGDDDATYALSVVHDESERRGYESRLRESEERLRQIAENLHEVLWITDPDKTVMHYVNPAYELVWGRSVEEVYDNPRSFVDAIHPEDRAHVEQLVARQAAGEYDAQYRIERPDGEIRWIWDRAVPIRDEAGVVTRIVGIAEDITELRNQETELRQAQKMEAVGQLTGGIAHDFNNLLTVILGNAEALRDVVPRDAEAREDLRAIISAGRRGASLTQRLLAYSRQQILSSDRVDVNALVGDMTALLRRTLGEQVDIETRLETGVAAIEVDRAQLETSIMNLAINARDAMPDGGTITLVTENATVAPGSSEARAGVDPGEYVRLRVSDTGHGMSPSVAAKVFDPFFTTKQPGKGTGLGLSTVYGFVRQSGGSIDVRSTPGHGTTFDVLLPRSAEAGEDGAAATGERRALPGGDETVLVVEDDAMVRAFTASQLRGLGYDVLEAGTGAEALDVLEQRGDVGLLFSDIVMPGGMSGSELAARVCRQRPGTRVLFTSGYADSAALDTSGWSNAASLLRKPYTPSQLARAVRDAIDAPV